MAIIVYFWLFGVQCGLTFIKNIFLARWAKYMMMTVGTTNSDDNDLPRTP